MKSAIVSVILASAPAFSLAFGSDKGKWKPPGHDDGEFALENQSVDMRDEMGCSED